ncbi:hypothetical protein RJT34_21916 [Clitoria ternatea]|uniref:3-hydroxyisobutyryl-CoA hydrolase n=1 Tax=Clitoria ternatea TaxID=43366 RepID=A0AAN9P639_CLITE
MVITTPTTNIVTVSTTTNVVTVTIAAATTMMDVINKCFSRKTVEEILSSLDMEATSNADKWISTTIQTLKKASPTRKQKKERVSSLNFTKFYSSWHLDWEVLHRRGYSKTAMASPTEEGHDHQILVQRKSCARLLTLNRPKQLNALSFYMVSRLLEIFTEDEGNSDIKLVFMKGNGRAFCAGGDVASVAHDGIRGNWRFGAKFFHTEYKLNYLMATYSKPQVSILNGIVMGGGAGASIHGRFRVVTENTVFAMPETALGLFPDVGASYFLSRLDGFFGEYVGLTGARLDGAEMLACGLASHFVPSSKLSLLEESLCKVETSDPTAVSAIIDKYSEQPFLKEDSVYHRMDVINKCFSRKTVEEILSSLDMEATSNADKWISTTIQTLKKASPTSLKIFLRLIREGRLLGIGQCLICEYRIVCHILRGHYSKDFFEGCRAILIDKDRNPKWKPSKLEQVSDSDVDSYFSKVEDDGWEDLELPKRFDNLPTYAISKL